MLPCGPRDAGLQPDFAKCIVIWLHGCCMGLAFGESRGRKPLFFFRVKWLRPAMKGTSCARRVRLRPNRGVIGSSTVCCNEWLFMCAWFYAFRDSLVADRSVWLHDCCRFVLPCASIDAGLQPDVAKRIVMAAWMLHGFRFWRKPGQETSLFFSGKVAPAGDERYLVCAAGAAAAKPGCNRFFHCVLQRRLFMCAWFYAFLDSLVADRNVMAA